MKGLNTYYLTGMGIWGILGSRKSSVERAAFGRKQIKKNCFGGN